MSSSHDGLTTVKNFQCTGEANFTNPHVDTSHLKSSLKVPGANAMHRYKAAAHQAGTVVTQRITIAIIDGVEANLMRPEVKAVVSACVGAATVTVDFLKNGTSILTGGTPVTLNAAAALTLQSPSLATTTAVQGDIIEANVVATAGGGTLPVGLAVSLIVEEEPAFV